MTRAEAIRVIGRQRPCEHENHDTNIGNGLVWAKCEDCGATFDRARLPDRQRAVEKFDEAIEVLSKGAK